MRARTPEDRKLIEIFDPIADALGLEIVRVRLMGSGNGSRRLQIMAERKSDGDINVEQCARLSRAISAYLDESDPISGDYTLEVSSPGIDRPLTRLKDFESWEGHEGRIELDRVAEGRKRFRGVLAGIEDEMIALNIEGEDETVLIPFAWVVDAKLTLTDSLMKQGAEARAERGEGGDDIDFGIEDFIDQDDEDSDPANDDSAEDEHE